MRATRLRRPVELNLTQIDFIDGCGLSMLINAMNRARCVGYELTIVETSRYVRRLIEITDTGDLLFPLAPGSGSRDERIAAEATHPAFDTAGTHAFRI
jgi:anti-anti-sigma factor